MNRKELILIYMIKSRLEFKMAQEEETIPEPKSRHEILKDIITNNGIFDQCVLAQKKATGKIQVGCGVEAYEYRNGSPYSFLFYGCNIHVSDSFGDTHAERMAIDNALKENCYPISIFVTSTSINEKVLLCGSCRHYISEINENCNIIIFDPDGTVKEISTIKEVYPHHKDVKEKNQRFFKKCLNGRLDKK